MVDLNGGDAAGVELAGVLLIPLIVGLIQFAKRFAPGAPGWVWLALSMSLGLLGYAIAHVGRAGPPEDLLGWAGLVTVGLSFGLAASKAYDETVG